MSKLFIDACFGKETSRTPVWIMRQAGRYLQEYRTLKKKYDFLTMCKTPNLATDITMLPITAVNPDAAILFSDILIVLPPLGINVSFNPNPIIKNPIVNIKQIKNLNVNDATLNLQFVYDTIKNIKDILPNDKALIGFCGAPLTLAAYMTGGIKKENFKELRALIYSNPKIAHILMDKLVSLQSQFLIAQIEAGAEAVQIFDTWAGSMPVQIVEEFVIPKIKTLIENVKKFTQKNSLDIPVIYFIKDSCHVLHLLEQTGADVISIDDKITLHQASLQIKQNISLQGNLDSAVLFTDKKTITKKVKEILKLAPKNRGHIFNLGHGILPDTPVENAKFMISEVKKLSQKTPPF